MATTEKGSLTTEYCVCFGWSINERIGGAMMIKIDFPKRMEVSYNVKATKDDDATAVTRVLDFSQCTADEIIGLVLDSAIILSQAQDRRDMLSKTGNGQPKAGDYVVRLKGRKTMSAYDRLVKAFGKANADKAVEKFGTAEEALKALAALIGDEE